MSVDQQTEKTHKWKYNPLNNLSIKERPVLLGILTFILLASLVGQLAYQRFLIKKKGIQKETFDFVTTTKEKLQESLSQGVSATKTLSLFIQKDGSVKDFDSVAAQILAASRGIDVLQLVPGGVIRNVYPLKGNENFIGYDILTDPFTNKEANKAIQKKELFFAGPYLLKQGEMGIVGRLPVYRDNRFWGFSAVIIKLATLQKSAGIDSLGSAGYYFQLSKINPGTNKEEFFISYPQHIVINNAVSVNIADGEWKLSAIPVNSDKESMDVILLSLLGFLISVLASVFVFTIAKRPEKLDALVKMRTAALQESEEKYRSLIEQASDGIIISGFDGIITEVNRSICTLGGYNAEEMVCSHIIKFMPVNDIEEQPLRIEELLQGRTLLYERRMLKKDGTVIDVEINSKMTIGNKLIGFVRDITERKKAEQDLKKSNERFELIAKATSDAIWDHDFIKNETVGNQNLYDLYNLTPEKNRIDLELFYARIHPEERKQIIINFQKAIFEKAVSVTEEFRFKTAGGIFKHFYDRAYIKYDDNGLPVRMLGVMQDITGRIKDRQKIIKEKELSDSIINSLPAVFYLYNEAGQFLRWNKNFEIVTGYTSDEIANLHPLDLFDDEEKIVLTEKIKNIFLSGEDSMTANFLLKNKQKIPYYFSGIKIEYEGETCLMGFGLDFSDKVKSDKIIKDSEEKFRSLVEQASDAVAILTPQGDPLYITPSIERILGYTETEAMKLNAMDITHRDDIETAEKLFKQALQNPGLPVKAPALPMLHKDGTWRWLEITITNMLHIPSINGIVENFRDVTEKLEIEKKIINEKELSDSIINSLPGIFYLFDYTGKLLRWNKNLETITGYSADEIKTMHPANFYSDEQGANLEERIKDVFQGRIPGMEFLLLTRDKRLIPVYYYSIPIEYESVPSILVIGFDLTDKKTIEQELLISNQNLELKATELKASYSELERFAYIVSHDLQEPLRMVSSFLKLLEQKYKAQLDETAEKYIHFAVDGSERMKWMITDLLEYSRTGTIKDIATDTDMNVVMAEVLDVMGNSIEEQNAEVKIASLPVLPATSKLQMLQLMQNLLSNSLKYHSEKKPVIKVSATEENDQWVFSVKDNGIGIDSKFFEKIFIIFQRLHNKNEFSGTGIGLSICKKIVEKHGGKIWVESSPGNGSVFYFSIPKK